GDGGVGLEWVELADRGLGGGAEARVDAAAVALEEDAAIVDAAEVPDAAVVGLDVGAGDVREGLGEPQRLEARGVGVVDRPENVALAAGARALALEACAVEDDDGQRDLPLGDLLDLGDDRVAGTLDGVDEQQPTERGLGLAARETGGDEVVEDRAELALPV